MSMAEQAAYLRGLAEGLGVDGSTKEGKLFQAIINVIGEASETIDGIEEFVNELSEQVDAIDEDLDTLESDFYEDYEDYDDEGNEYYDVECEKCGQEFTIDEETLLEGEVVCPGCGEKLEFDVECDDDCDCQHGKD